jgi:hypothetical protein
VASAKVAHPPFQEIEREFADFCGDLERVELTESDLQSANFGLNAKVCDYFHPRTLEEVLKAKKILGVDGLSPARNFIKASLLHILHGNRPYALSRTSHPITPFSPSGPFEYRSVAQRLDQRLERLKRVEWPDKFEAGSSWHADFRELPNLLADQVDAIICSPPFPGMRFDRPNWLRMWFCGWEAEDFHVRSREFLERQQGRTFAVYREFFQVSQAVLRPRGSAVLHVGGSKGYDMATKLIEVAKPFFRHRGTVAESVAHLEKHGIKDKGTTTSHILLLFERI